MGAESAGGDEGAGGREQLRLIPPGRERDSYWSLLLLAAGSEPQVRSYYQQGDLYVLDDATGAPLGLVLTLPAGDGAVELKAVAVTPERHNQGIGKRLLALVLADLRARGARRAILGTGTSGIGQLAFYQKAGFRLWRIERDFFSPERGYPEGIEENGIPLRDMVWMDMDLKQDSDSD